MDGLEKTDGRVTCLQPCSDASRRGKDRSVCWDAAAACERKGRIQDASLSACVRHGGCWPPRDSWWWRPHGGQWAIESAEAGKCKGGHTHPRNPPVSTLSLLYLHFSPLPFDSVVVYSSPFSNPTLKRKRKKKYTYPVFQGANNFQI